MEKLTWCGTRDTFWAFFTRRSPAMLRKMWTQYAHLICWSLPAAIVLTILSRSILIGIASLCLSLSVQSLHSQHHHPEDPLGNPAITPILGGLMGLCAVLAVIMTDVITVILVCFGMYSYDVSIHARQHLPEHPFGNRAITIGAFALACAGALVLPT